jgi:hypothetical protein
MYSIKNAKFIIQYYQLLKHHAQYSQYIIIPIYITLFFFLICVYLSSIKVNNTLLICTRSYLKSIYLQDYKYCIFNAYKWKNNINNARFCLEGTNNFKIIRPTTEIEMFQCKPYQPINMLRILAHFNFLCTNSPLFTAVFYIEKYLE